MFNIRSLSFRAYATFVVLFIAIMCFTLLPSPVQIGPLSFGRAGVAGAVGENWIDPAGGNQTARIKVDITENGGGAKDNYATMFDVLYNGAIIDTNTINEILYRPVTRYVGIHDRTYMINCSSAGVVSIQYWDEDGLVLSSPVILKTGLSGYDHDGGNVLILQHQTGGLSGRNGKPLVSYSSFMGTPAIYSRGSNDVENISSWGNEVIVATSAVAMAYSTLVELGNGTVMCFYNWWELVDVLYHGPVYYRIATLNTDPSLDTWSAATEVADLCNTQSYYRIWFDGTDIHFILGARYGSSDQYKYQDVWYINYQTSDGTWRTGNGTEKVLPFDLSDASHTPDVVWVSSDSPWHSTIIWDIKTDGSNNPYLVFIDSVGASAARGDAGSIYRAYYSSGWQCVDTGIDTMRHGQSTYNPMAGAELDEYNVNIMYACVPDGVPNSQLQAYQNVGGTWYIADGDNGTTAIATDGKITQASPGDNFRVITVLHGAGHFKFLWFYSERYADPNSAIGWESMRLAYPGFSNQNHLCFNKNVRTDFGDLRLTQSDGSTLQPTASDGKPWIQEKTDSWRAILWLNIGNVTGTTATLTTSLTGSNNNLVYTSVIPGSLGNNTSISYTDPASAQYGLTTAFDMGSADTGTMTNQATGYVVLQKYAATVSGKITHIRVRAAVAGNVKVALYADNAGAIGSLLGKQNTSTACATGWTSVALDANPDVTATTNYWIAVTADTTGTATYAGAGSVSRAYKAVTYSTFTFNGLSGLTYDSAVPYFFQAYYGIWTPSVAVSGTDITVTLSTNISSAINTTATKVKTAVDGYPAAAALATVANAGGNDGSGIVTAMAHTHLSGGVSGTTTGYAYHGDPAATNANTQAIMDAQFLACDGFDNGTTLDTNKWTLTNTVGVASGNLELTSVASNRGIIDQNTANYPAFTYAEARMKIKGSDTAPGDYCSVGLEKYGEHVNADSEWVSMMNIANVVYSSTYKAAIGTSNSIAAMDTANWHIWSINWRVGNVGFYSDVNSTTNRMVAGLQQTHITNVSAEAHVLNAWEGLTNLSGIEYVDWIFARPRTNPEPIVSAIAQELPDISNTPSSHDFGIVQPSFYTTSYWAKAGLTPPSFPLADGNCTGNVTNHSGFAINVLFSMGNLTGGTQWTPSTSPGTDIFVMRIYISGAAGIGNYTALSATPIAVITNLAAAASKNYEFAIDIPSWYSDIVAKSGNITLAAEAY